MQGLHPKSYNHYKNYHHKNGNFSIRAAMIALMLVVLIILLVALGAMVFLIADLRAGEKSLIRTKRSSVPSYVQKHLPGLEAIQLQGTQPTAREDANGIIGPWALSNDDITWANINQQGTELTVLRSGTYFVYAQVFYLTNEESNTFRIVKYQAERDDETLSLCASKAATQRTGDIVESSCFTGVMTKLEAGDHLLLHQIDPKRTIVLTPGFSFWGLMKLQDNKSEM